MSKSETKPSEPYRVLKDKLFKKPGTEETKTKK